MSAAASGCALIEAASPRPAVVHHHDSGDRRARGARGLLIAVDQTSRAIERTAYLPNYARSLPRAASSYANHSYAVLPARAQHNSPALGIAGAATAAGAGGSCKSSASDFEDSAAARSSIIVSISKRVERFVLLHVYE